METANLNIKKKRVIRFFLEAATKIAKEEGIHQLSIRKVSKEAGYNSSTLYNYFDNLDQLLEFTAINCIVDYLNDLSIILSRDKHPALRYIEAWECYCRYSFNAPSIYTYVFASQFSDKVLANLRLFARMFPESLPNANISREALKFIVAPDIKTRDTTLIENCVSCGYFAREDADDITRIGYILHDGLMHQMEHYPQKIPNAIELFHRYFIEYLEIKRQQDRPNLKDLGETGSFS